MDLLILDGLDITIDLSEIAAMKGLRIDNPTYIAAMPTKGIPEQNFPPYYSKTEVILKSGEKILLDVAYSQMVLVIKKWLSQIPSEVEPTPETEGELLQEEKPKPKSKKGEK